MTLNWDKVREIFKHEFAKECGDADTYTRVVSGLTYGDDEVLDAVFRAAVVAGYDVGHEEGNEDGFSEGYDEGAQDGELDVH